MAVRIANTPLIIPLNCQKVSLPQCLSRLLNGDMQRLLSTQKKELMLDGKNHSAFLQRRGDFLRGVSFSRKLIFEI